MADWLSRLGKGVGRFGTGAATGAAAGSVVPGVGNVVGGIGGGLLGLANAFTSDGYEEQADAASYAAQLAQQQAAQERGAYRQQADEQNAMLAAIAQRIAQEQNPYTTPGVMDPYINQQNDDITRQYAGADDGLTASLAARGMLGSGQEASGLAGIANRQAMARIDAERGTRQHFFDQAQGYEQNRNAQAIDLNQRQYTNSANAANGAADYGNQQANYQQGLAQTAYGRAAQADQGAGATYGNAFDIATRAPGSFGAYQAGGPSLNKTPAQYQPETKGGFNAGFRKAGSQPYAGSGTPQMGGGLSRTAPGRPMQPPPITYEIPGVPPSGYPSHRRGY